MPFLPPNQQRQSTEGYLLTYLLTEYRVWCVQCAVCVCVCVCVVL